MPSLKAVRKNLSRRRPEGGEALGTSVPQCYVRGNNNNNINKKALFMCLWPMTDLPSRELLMDETACTCLHSCSRVVEHTVLSCGHYRGQQLKARAQMSDVEPTGLSGILSIQ